MLGEFLLFMDETVLCYGYVCVHSTSPTNLYVQSSSSTIRTDNECPLQC